MPDISVPILSLKMLTVISLVVVLSFGFVPGVFVRASPAPGTDHRAPDVPPNLEVPDGNKVSFHVFAAGVQIYVWTGASWVFQAPEAVLFSSSHGGVVGTHYAGPTWESNSGSKVVGQRVDGSTVDPTAIPWLLLQARTTEGPGIFARTTYVQRVNTVGGLAPATPGTAEEVARVPYTAEYYFYTAHNNGAERASAVLRNSAGDVVGFAQFMEDATGLVHVNVHVKSVSPGLHGIHIHTNGACTPDFSAAGGHYDPFNKEHGLDNPSGPEAGDLPNLTANEDGVGHLNTRTDRVTVSPGPTTLFDGNGSALVVHANPDDQISQPIGGSGPRIACGVIEQA